MLLMSGHHLDHKDIPAPFPALPFQLHHLPLIPGNRSLKGNHKERGIQLC